MAKNLDIDTPNGAITRKDEAEGLAIFAKHTPEWNVVPTPKSKSTSVIDAVSHDIAKVEVNAIVETKARRTARRGGGPPLTIDLFLANSGETKGGCSGLWLIGKKKVYRAAFIGKELDLPFLGFLYLPISKILLVTKLACRDGGIIHVVDEKVITTQDSCNGGEKKDTMLYIDMTHKNVLLFKHNYNGWQDYKYGHVAWLDYFER